MKYFTACFVVVNKKNEIEYISHMMSGYRYPEHTLNDIVDMCNIMNSITARESRYVDIFHVLDANGSTIWIESIDAEKARDSFRPVLED